jgi:RimJ/RimL family protein N-acetyltransferase
MTEDAPVTEASNPAPVVETERLRIRRLALDDAAFILELLTDPSFLRNIGDRGVANLEDARRYLRNGPMRSYEEHGFGLYLTTRKEDGAPIGICGLLKRDALDDVDVGFAFLPRYWSKGYATESARAVVAYGKDVLGLPRIVAVTRADNDGSIRVLRKLGMRFEKTVRLTEGGPALELYA